LSEAIAATAAATEAVIRLRERHGEITLHQSGGCCGGSSPMCLTAAELPAGPNDLQLGEIGGAPFLIDRDLYEAWGRPSFVLDLEPGAIDSFSLETGDGVHFTTRAPAPPAEA